MKTQITKEMVEAVKEKRIEKNTAAITVQMKEQNGRMSDIPCPVCNATRSLCLEDMRSDIDVPQYGCSRVIIKYTCLECYAIVAAAFSFDDIPYVVCGETLYETE